MTDARTLTQALGGKWSGRNGVACCPAHNDKNPSLSIADGTNGRLLFKCHAGCSYGDILDALRSRGLLDGRGRSAFPDPAREYARKAEDRAHAAKRSGQARDVWQAGVPVTGTVAETYLRGRGITCALPETLRYVPECWHPTAKRFPAMVGYIEGTDGFAVHRTYLRPDGGKVGVSPPRAMLGATMGGAVHLSDRSRRLVVAEGIETALSLLSGLVEGPATVWAALSASGMKGLRLPKRPGQLMIAPDGDTVGQDAARALADRAHALGWQVSLLPAPDGCDWNDVLTGKAMAA